MRLVFCRFRLVAQSNMFIFSFTPHRNRLKKFYAGQVHYRANMRLHNQENLINFVAVPGSYRNFHGKSGQTFL